MGMKAFRSCLVVELCLVLWTCECWSAYVEGSVTRQIPQHVWDQLKNLNSSEDFIKHHITKKPGPITTQEEQILFSQTGSLHPTGISIIAGMIAEPDTCQPKLMSVTVPPDPDARILYWPTCTMLQQCGGCCGHEMHECVPTKTEQAPLQVMKARYPDNGGDRFEFEGLVDVKLEIHLACECRCRVQAIHCNQMIHQYSEETCSCQCLNNDQATGCPSKKKWDDSKCACLCPKILHCLDDEFFNYNSCDCQKGSPGSITSTLTTIKPSGTTDACATLNCRPGYQPVKTSDKCVCRIISRRSSELHQRSSSDDVMRSLGDVRLSSSRSREHH